MTDETRAILSSHLLRLLSNREYPKTICPSEVARAVTSSELATMGVDTRRDLMPIVRKLAWDLRESSLPNLEVLQGGQVVNEGVALEDIRGPIRLRLGQGAK